MGLSLSIVTICFNNPDEMIATCRSVDEQVHKPHEHIIVDGSKNNGIVQWLENNAQPAYRQWKNEPDKGISDAFNKGVQQSTGDVVHILNSGDHYFDKDATAIAMEAFDKDPELMWLHGKYVQFQGGSFVVSGLPFHQKKVHKGMRQTGHPTMFVKRELYEKYGLFSLDKKVAMDYDFLVRIRNEKFAYIDKPLTVFMPGGTSEIQREQGAKEIKESYEEYVGKDLRIGLYMWKRKMLLSFLSTSLGKFLFRIRHKKNLTEIKE